MIVVAGFIPAFARCALMLAGVNPATTLVCADLEIIADSVTRIYNMSQPANSRCDTVRDAGMTKKILWPLK